MILDLKSSRSIREYQAGSIEAMRVFESKLWVSVESLLVELEDLHEMRRLELILELNGEVK